MNGKIKRLLAMLLACVFCMSLLPEIAFAAEPEKFEIDFTQVEKTTLYEYTTGAYYINNTKTGSSYNYSAMRKSGGNGVEWSVLLEKADSPILAKANAVRFFPGNSDVRGMYMMFYNSHIAADQDAVTVEFEVPVTGVYDMLIDAAYDYLGGIGSFYVDGAQMGGDIDFYTASSTTTLKQDVPVAGKVSLTAGTHKLRIKGNHQSKTDVSVVGEDAKNKNAANIDIRKVTFAPRGGVASVEASCNTNYMLLGNTNGVQLSVSAKYRSGFNVDIANDAEVEFTSSDENIALVSDAGVVTPVSAGDVEITVRVTGGDSITPASDTVKLAVVDTGASERFEVDFTQVDQSTLYEYKAGAYYLTSNKIEGQTFSAARKSDGDGVEWNILLTKADSPILAKNTGVRFFPANNDVRGMYIMFYNGNIDDGQGALSFEFTAPETGLYDVLIDAAYQDLGGIAKFYIDGMPMGEEIDFYITETDAKLREGVPVAAQMYITEGKHKIRIEAKKQPKTESGTKAANIDIRKFIFSPRGGVASAELKYDKKFILLDDADGEKLNLFAKYESGFDVDVENEAAVSFASSDDTIATVTDKGVVMPVSLGNVVITAKIAAGESDVPATAEFALTVSNEPIYDGFVVDFTNQTAETAYQATIETNGWEFNREKSDAYLLSTRDGTDVSRYSTYGLLLQPGSTEQRNQISIDFLVPSSGNYDIEFSGKTGANGGAASLYIDGKFVGTYDFYTIDDLTNVRKKLRSLYLTGGEKHTLTFRAPDEGPNWMQFTPTSVTFTGTEALTPVIGAGAERTRNSIAVGESEEFELYFIQRNGAEWFVREPIFGTDTVSAEMTVGNTEIADVDGNLIRARAPGNVTMSIAGEIDGEPVADSFTFNVNENTYDHAEIDVVYDIFYEGGQTEISASAYLSDGSLINARDIEYTFSTSDEGKAIVDENNILHTNNEGTVTVIAHVTFNGDTLDASTEINIVPVALERIEAKTEDAIVSMRDNDGSRIVVTGVNNDGSANALDGAIFKYENLSPEIIEVTDNGYVFPVQRGSAQVKVSAFLGGLEFSCTADVVSSSQKTEPTIYTYEMRENALENIKKYSWAKEARDAAVESADKWVEKLDALYGMITYEGFPRANTIGLREDQEAYNCVYCGLDIRDKYGWYGWIINPLSRKWKIQCPECKRLFPSNDFESFYELGLDQKGQFDRLRALEAHRAMLLAQGKIDTSVAEPGEEWSDEWCAYYGYGQGYLENTAYKDVNKTLGIAGNKVSTWAVDDGFGWDTGEVMPSGLPVKKAFIAQYHHYIYYKSDSADSGIMKTALNAIRDAYLYTGDMKYGRAGAILIDRIADVYPSFNRSLHPAYQNSDGETFAGKILGSIWEHEIANVFVRAYDAFYPAMEDPQVIAYLSAKAEEFGLENPKTNANMIRENCEDGVVREVGAAVKRAQVRGNHGMHQSVMTLAAVALDTFPETAEMLDWLSVQERFGITTSTQYGQSYRTRSSNAGGSILHYLVNEVDRDGFGWEIGADYNQGWLMNQRTIAETLYHYGKYDKLNLYENAKFRKMFDSTINMTMAGGYTVQLGDFRSTAGITNQTSVGTMLLGFKRLGDPKYAQIVYYLKGGNLDNVYIDIFEKNAEDIQDEIRAVIEQYGEYKFESRNKTGFGLAVLSGGELVKGSNAGKNSDFRRDSWLWYGRTDKSHGHWDMLSMGIDAYGFNFTPDLGYPDATLFSGKKYQWVQNTLSHNTVVVDGDWQKSVLSGRPLHFDDSGIVKVVDAEAPHAYDQTDIYRRTLVSVDASGEVAYTVDFFRIKGGSEHIYSFHTQSQDGVTTDDLTLVKQVDKDGNYIGTYAGPDTEYGDDPATDISVWYCETMYPRGYTYLKNVSRDEAPESGEFSVNFKQTDFKKQVVSDKGLNLKFTALNDWTPSSVGFAAGEPPRIIQNNVIRHLDYMLIHRKAENDKQLDTLFTSVIQPYNGEEYIEAMQSIALESSGGENADDTSKAVRVTLKNGRTDYVIYATNPDITYSISDTVNGNAVEFDFEGFVGVYSVDKNGNKIYAYVNDGGKIGDLSVAPRYTGQVVSFTAEGLVPENFITVDVNEEMTAEEVSSLAGRYIYVDNAGAEYTGGNGAYKIISASVNKQNEEHIDLDIGDVTLVKAYTDNSNPSKGYRYNIEAEQTFTIPLSASQDSAPEIWVQGDITTSAGSSVTMQVSSSSPAEEKISYVGTVLPRGASLNPETGKVTWKPDASQVGENGFMITARDESGRESSVTFTVTVYGATTGGSSNDKSDKTDVSTDNAGTETSSGGGGGDGGGGDGGGGGAAPTPDDSSKGDVEDGSSDVPNDEDTTQSDEKDTENAPDASGETEVLRFTDIGNHAWAADAINTLAADGIIKGTSASTFSPAANITRADFALLLVRAFRLTSDNAENFADVSASDYFAPELAIARNTGIAGGIGENRFAPRNSITRQDMMVIVYRALQKLGVEFGGSIEPQYEDYATVADYAKTAVSELIGAGLVNGKNNLIAPLDYTTRAEVAVLIKRILDYTKQ